jgi:peptide/nickel transport system ATP-binding protein
VETLYANPSHPYTAALMEAIPALSKKKKSILKTIPGTVPVPINLKPGCGFFNRCEFARDGACNTADIPMTEVSPGHQVRCIAALERSGTKRRAG